MMKCAIHSYIYYARTISNCPEKYDVTKVMAMYNSFKRNLIQVSNKNGLQLMIMRIMKIAILRFERSSSFVYTRGLQTFLFKGHISYYTTVRGPDILRNLIASGYVKLYMLNSTKSISYKYIFYYCQNVFAGWMKWRRGPHLARGP